MQVYLAINAGSNVLVVLKRTVNSWWHGASARTAKAVNQANQWALPGGRLNDGEEVIAGALREFGEESGLMLAATSASSLTVVEQNDDYALVQFEVSPDRLIAICNQVNANVSPSSRNIGRPTDPKVLDWEWQNAQIIPCTNLINFLGVRRAIPTPDIAAVSARPAHSQDISWYADMGHTLRDF